MADPTLQEMMDFLGVQFGTEFDETDKAEACYWFASDYHGGQFTNLYAALCASEFHPGPCSNGPEKESSAEMMYEALEEEYSK